MCNFNKEGFKLTHKFTISTSQLYAQDTLVLELWASLQQLKNEWRKC